MPDNQGTVTRRTFLAASAVGSVAAVAAPAVVTASKTDKQTILGAGDYRYEVIHQWPQLPDKFSWQITHNVAVDAEQNLYVIHEGDYRDHVDHPNIFVFDSAGKYIRSFGSQFQGGGHGLEVRSEDGEQFLYVCAYQHKKTFAKLTLTGEIVWQKYAPMESGLYPKGESTNPQNLWGRDRFLPTNFAFLDDGDFLLVDGYGSYRVHRYDNSGNWKSMFGGLGEGQGSFNLPHGIWVDQRPGREPSIVVVDRRNHVLQYFTLDGEYRETLSGFGLPANADTWQDLMVIPELFARVTILDGENNVVARLGDDVARIKEDGEFAIRKDPATWRDGRFIHPHDACFDQEGNIFVAEWVASGRVSKLKRLA
jgi:hypothetical protein